MGLGLSSLISMVVITKSGSLRYDFILSKCSKKKPQSILGESENGGSEKNRSLWDECGIFAFSGYKKVSILNFHM